jgi:hypothetical protein
MSGCVMPLSFAIISGYSYEGFAPAVAIVQNMTEENAETDLARTRFTASSKSMESLLDSSYVEMIEYILSERATLPKVSPKKIHLRRLIQTPSVTVVLVFTRLPLLLRDKRSCMRNQL